MKLTPSLAATLLLGAALTTPLVGETMTGVFAPDSVAAMNTDGMLRPHDPYARERWKLGLGAPEGELIDHVDDLPTWFLRVEYAWATDGSIGDLVSGDINILGNNGAYCLTGGRYVLRNLFNCPLDLSLNATVCYHPANSNQDDIYQFIAWFQLHWTYFPWNDHLRTRFSVGEGLSYVTDIPYAESVRRDFNPSENLLNYLDFSLSFNLADLCEVTCLSRILPEGTPDALENAWLVGALHHRSGAWGLFGHYRDEDGNREPIKGGLNQFTLGITMEF